MDLFFCKATDLHSIFLMLNLNGSQLSHCFCFLFRWKKFSERHVCTNLSLIPSCSAQDSNLRSFSLLIINANCGILHVTGLVRFWNCCMCVVNVSNQCCKILLGAHHECLKTPLGFLLCVNEWKINAILRWSVCSLACFHNCVHNFRMWFCF